MVDAKGTRKESRKIRREGSRRTTYDAKRAKYESWTSVMLTPWSPLHLVAEGLRLRRDTDGYRFSVF